MLHPQRMSRDRMMHAQLADDDIQRLTRRSSESPKEGKILPDMDPPDIKREVIATLIKGKPFHAERSWFMEYKTPQFLP